MIFEELEHLAKENEPLPKHYEPEEYFCYKIMNSIYKEYRGKRIGREQAKAEKLEVMLMFGRLVEDHNRQSAAWAQYQEFIRRSNGLTYEIRRALESGAEASELIQLVMELYGNLVGDFTLTNLIAEKLKKGTKPT